MQIDIVDETNSVIGSAPAQHVYRDRLNHRIVQILIINDAGEFYLVQRSAKHEYCPGQWTIPSGQVLANELYDHAAQRELSLWLNISLPLIKIHETFYDHYKMRKFIEVFRARTSGPFNLNLDLATHGKWFSLPDVLALISKNQFVYPEFAHVFEQLYSQKP